MRDSKRGGHPTPCTIGDSRQNATRGAACGRFNREGANRFVPLALLVFAPFIVNAVAFHVFLERSGLPMALVFLALELFPAWVHRDSFRTVLAARVPGR